MVLKFNNSNQISDFPFFKKRLIEAIGIILCIFSFILTLSLFSFTPNDPSFSNLTDSKVQNLVGTHGAYASDALLNLFGVGSIMIILISIAWGGQLFFKKKISFFWVRLIFMPITIVCSAIALDSIILDDSWPLNAGAGGIIGKYISIFIVNFFNDINFYISKIYISFFFSFLTLFSLNISIGFSQEDWLKFSNFVFNIIKRIFKIFLSLSNFLVIGLKKIFPIVEPFLGKILKKFQKKEDDLFERSETTNNDLVNKKDFKTKPGKLLKEDSEPEFNFVENSDYELPKLSLLNENIKKNNAHNTNTDLLKQNAKLLENVLKEFNIDAKVIGINPGPIVTLYELEPAPGTQTKRIISLTDDIARSMSAESARISNVVGKNAVGIELPNQERETVYLKEIFGSKDFDSSNSVLPLVFGKNISGRTIIHDLSKMPHLLIAGTTGSGKSVGLNAMILSLIYSLRPDECKFIMIDPKMLELSVYDKIPHLITPVVTDPRKAIYSLKWLVREMEQRYKLMSKIGVRNISSFNEKIKEKKINGEIIMEKIQTGFDSETGKPIYEDRKLDLKILPFIVVIIDEIADLMLVSGKDVESSVQRLSQMARAAGIHLIVATQRPSVDVLTGTIKANFSSRISYQVASKIDSRTIIGDQGAENLLGQGDMLIMSGAGNISRVHGPFVKDDEVANVVKFIKSQGEPNYVAGITDDFEEKIKNNVTLEETDELYSEAVKLVTEKGRASTSFIQRHFQIGYNRAARIIEAMEKNNIVSQADRVGRREVLALKS